MEIKNPYCLVNFKYNCVGRNNDTAVYAILSLASNMTKFTIAIPESYTFSSQFSILFKAMSVYFKSICILLCHIKT